MYLRARLRTIVTFEKYLTVRNYFAKGNGELSWLRYLTYLIGVERALNSSLSDVILLGVSYLVLSVIIGVVYDKRHYFQVEHEWMNRRNPFVMELRNNSVLNINGKQKEELCQEKGNVHTGGQGERYE